MTASWTARWIWAAGSDAVAVPFGRQRAAGAPRSCLIRRTLSLGAPPAEVPLRVTADARYVLFVNGREVASGPARAAVDRRTWTEIDVGPHLVDGDNAFAAIVHWYGSAGPWWVPVVPSFTLGFGSFLLEAPAIELISDRRWRAIDGPYRDPGPPHLVMGAHPTTPTEDIDLAALPADWNAVGFDDTAWPAAQELQGFLDVAPANPPFTTLEPDELPQLTRRPIAMQRGDGLWDARGIVLATPVVDLEGPDGAEVEVVAGEDLDGDGDVLTEPRAWRMRIRCGDTRRRVEALDAVGFRYLRVNASAGVQVHAVSATERVHPRVPVGTFMSDDERVDAIWEAAVRTLELCSTDAFEDCPGRERRSWLGDAPVEALATYAVDGDWSLPRRQLRLAAASVRGDGFLPMVAGGDHALAAATIVAYSMDFARALARHVEHAGLVDLPLIASVAPTVTRLLDEVERFRGADGLLRDVPGWVFVDWAPIEQGPVTGSLDGRYAAALRDHATVLDWLGDGRGADLRRRADLTAESFEALWDPDRGVYVDALLPSGARSRRVSQQTNAAAVVGGLVPSDRWTSVVDQALDPARAVCTRVDLGLEALFQLRAYPRREDGRPFDETTDVVAAQPTSLHLLHEALGTVGRGDLVVESILRWHPFVASEAERGVERVTLPELWVHQPGATSRAHGVNGTIASDLVHHVLGLQILEPGFGSVRVAPALGTLRWASATVPTPHGALRIHADATGSRVEAPAGVGVR